MIFQIFWLYYSKFHASFVNLKSSNSKFPWKWTGNLPGLGQPFAALDDVMSLMFVFLGTNKQRDVVFQFIQRRLGLWQCLLCAYFIVCEKCLWRSVWFRDLLWIVTFVNQMPAVACITWICWESAGVRLHGGESVRPSCYCESCRMSHSAVSAPCKEMCTASSLSLCFSFL